MAQRGALAGSGSLLEGVVVPCDVPFPVLETAVEALYSGSVELRTDNIEPLLRLADATLVGWACERRRGLLVEDFENLKTLYISVAPQIAELREKCVLAAIDSLETGGVDWVTSMYATGAALNIPSLAERALGWLAFSAHNDNNFWSPLRERLPAAADKHATRWRHCSRGSAA